MKFEDVDFMSNQIILHKKNRDINIYVDDIKYILYEKPTILKFFFIVLSPYGVVYPGRLEIYLKKKIGKTKLYLVRIKYKDVLKLPQLIKNKIQ